MSPTSSPPSLPPSPSLSLSFPSSVSFSKDGQQRVQDCENLEFVVVTNTMPLEGSKSR